MPIRRESALNDVRNSELLFENINFFFSPDGFSGDGCNVDPIQSSSEDTVCKCNHLTHFAVLVDFSGGPEVFFFTLVVIFFFVISVLGQLIHCSF